MRTTHILLVVGALGVAACGSSTTSGSSGSALSGDWRASVTGANGVEASAVWRFYDDGHVDALIVQKNNGTTVTNCAANTLDSHWEDRGGKVIVRFGDKSTEHLYELTEGGARLHLEPPVSRPGGGPVNTYERVTDVTDDCRTIDAGA